MKNDIVSPGVTDRAIATVDVELSMIAHADLAGVTGGGGGSPDGGTSVDPHGGAPGDNVVIPSPDPGHPRTFPTPRVQTAA
jgi:hypothetical protein